MKFLLEQLISVSRPSLVLPKLSLLIDADFSHSGVKATAAICLYLEICAKGEHNSADTRVSNPVFPQESSKAPEPGALADGYLLN